VAFHIYLGSLANEFGAGVLEKRVEWTIGKVD
jgi:hypothetical protein